MGAVDLAVAALSTKLAAPPLSPQQIQAWGATDEAGARRIARVFHRRDLRISPTSPPRPSASSKPTPTPPSPTSSS
ncbi:MAG: hypothetical protein R3B70_10255 [Polyangiaceae bacterium]